MVSPRRPGVAWRRTAGIVIVSLVAGAVSCTGSGHRVTPAVGRHPPVIVGLHAPGTVARLHRFEASASILPVPENPFDPDQLDLRGHFVDPAGHEHIVPGFYGQDFRRSLTGDQEAVEPVASPVWKVRFAPTVSGPWVWWWSVTTPGGEAVSPRHGVRVLAAADPGFVHLSRHDGRYLSFDDGTPYFAVGENVAWYGTAGTFDYDRWYGRLGAQHATYTRVFLASGFELEVRATGPGRYDLGRAWQLDHVIEAGERQGLYQVLSLFNFEPLRGPAFADHLYNRVQGGPLATPARIFTDQTAKVLYRRRLRYAVARWGYSTHLLAWELGNEPDLVEGAAPAAVAAWTAEMAATVRSLDGAGHLVVTSSAGGPSPVLDYDQVHLYLDQHQDIAGDPALGLAGRLTGTGPQRRPALVAELGVDSRGPTHVLAEDPEGVVLHDGLWVAPMIGAFGTGMSWWWDSYVDVDPERFYPMFGAVGRFLAGVRWDREHFVASRPTVGASLPLAAYGLLGDAEALVWVKNLGARPLARTAHRVTAATLELGLRPGRWCGAWWDTWTGQPREPVDVQVTGAGSHLAMPEFDRDLALRLAAC